MRLVPERDGGRLWRGVQRHRTDSLAGGGEDRVRDGGAMVTIGVSPAPADGRSLRSTRTTSISGTSRKRGTRYWRKCGFRILPSSKSIDFEQRAAQALDHRSFH